ncbi:hypothetical protein [Bdellovibrio bacteriovorus]|uniref:hypothetical protein n=1 Tax=Bdellovibrio bacteriovorus TaxID=959 RepID=UPI0035A83293
MKMNRMVMLAAGLCMMAPALSQARTEILSENTELGMTFVDLASRPRNLEDCQGLTLDDAQKTALKQAKFEYMKQKNTLDATAKNAWIDYAHTLMDMASTKDQGTAAGGVVKDAMGAAGQAKLDFEIKVFYDILKPEQRETAFKCIMKHMKQKMADKLKRACSKLPPETKP